MLRTELKRHSSNLLSFKESFRETRKTNTVKLLDVLILIATIILVSIMYDKSKKKCVNKKKKSKSKCSTTSKAKEKYEFSRGEKNLKQIQRRVTFRI